MNFKILDCTIRDGGYYTNWEFNDSIIDNYLSSMNKLPVDYLEIGYRSPKMNSYLGKYFYLPLEIIKSIKDKSNKKLVIILNEKDIQQQDLEDILSDCQGLIDLVRIAIDPKNIRRAIPIAIKIKEMGFKVGFNVMYMSEWMNDYDFFEMLPEINDYVDFFYMVDSYGGVSPTELIEIYKKVSKYVNVPIGFHGHNNLELALINTITAIECGVDIVDSTITGMGRGAGNLKTELLLTYLESKGLIELDFNSISKVVESFSDLQEKYGWGTSLPYMVSGANSLPQKDVMEWVSKRFYSFNSIIRSLANRSKGLQDNMQFKKLVKGSKYDSILLIGGGPSVSENSWGLNSFVKKHKGMLIIHSSSTNAMNFINCSNDQIFCLVGNEGYRLEKIFDKELPDNCKCILPPYPRKMGTYIPKEIQNQTLELETIELRDVKEISHTLIALQSCLNFETNNIYIAGYDGYENTLSRNEKELFIENDLLFNEFRQKIGKSLLSLTPTTYSNLEKGSVYAELL